MSDLVVVPPSASAKESKNLSRKHEKHKNTKRDQRSITKTRNKKKNTKSINIELEERQPQTFKSPLLTRVDKKNA
jgi:hypothetical protein